MKRMFVAMPYDEKKGPLDYRRPEQTVEIDFDGVWKEILSRAVPPGFEVKRAIDLRRAGPIDRLYIKWLLEADVVLADLTFFNPNVYYEFGIRHALAKKGTVLVACEGTELTFDFKTQSVYYYSYFAAPRIPEFISTLREVIENTALQDVDSPVHIFVPELFVKSYESGQEPDVVINNLKRRIEQLEQERSVRQSREEEERFLEKLNEARDRGRIFSLYRAIVSSNDCSVRLLEKLALKLRDFGYFDEEIEVLERGLTLNPNDWALLRELGFAFRKKGLDFFPQAQSYMERALEINDADAELHGMVGGLFKRRNDYDSALAHYRRGYELEPESLYAIVTVAGMLRVKGLTSDAEVFYKKLQTISERIISQGSADHWTYFGFGHAAVAFGDEKTAMEAYRIALEKKPPIEHVRSEVEQLEFLQEHNFAAETIARVLPMLREYLKQ